jgi:hypothetical protein
LIGYTDDHTGRHQLNRVLTRVVTPAARVSVQRLLTYSYMDRTGYWLWLSSNWMCFGYKYHTNQKERKTKKCQPLLTARICRSSIASGSSGSFSTSASIS